MSKLFAATFFLLLLYSFSTAFAALRYTTPNRPMAGVGVLFFKKNLTQNLYLYEEPGISRTSELSASSLPNFDGLLGNSPPLIVTRQKGEWYKVIYDDAGREGWIKPGVEALFASNDSWLRQKTATMAKALQKKYYILCQKPEYPGTVSVTPSQQLKVLQLRDVWAQVLTENGIIGWLRFKDDDGRLIFSVTTEKKEK